MKRLKKISPILLLMIFQMTANHAQEFNWAVGVGQESVNEGRCIGMDSNNDVVHAGIFWGSPDFDPGENEYRLTSAGDADIFIQKLDVNSNLIWAARMGGLNWEELTAMAIDSDDNIYLTGIFSWKTNLSTSNDTSANFESKGSGDIFIVKLNSTGDTEWFKVFPGLGDDFVSSIVLDDVDNPIIAGSFAKTIDFNSDPLEENLVTSKGADDAFILKLSRSGNRLWIKTFGNESGEQVTALAIDTANNVIAGGEFRGTVDFADNTAGSTLTSAGYDDSFILKIDTRANFIWVKHISSDEGSPAIYALDTDSLGNIYTNAEFFTTLDLDKNGNGYVIEPNEEGYSDFALAHYKSDGSFVWAKHFVNEFDYIEPHGLKISKNGEIFLAGQFRGTIDCNPEAGKSVLTTPSDDTDIFLIKLSPTGSYIWSGQAGGLGEERCLALSLGGENKILLTGLFQKPADMNPILAQSFLMTPVAFYDAYAIMMTDQTITSSEYNSKSTELLIYPNPVSDFATIQLPVDALNRNARIISMDGTVLRTFQFSGENSFQLDFRDFSPGIYFIHIDSEQGIAPVKLVKK